MDVSPAQRCLQGFGGVAAALRPGCKNPTGLRRAVEGRFEIAPEVAEADLAHEGATSPLLHQPVAEAQKGPQAAVPQQPRPGLLGRRWLARYVAYDRWVGPHG